MREIFDQLEREWRETAFQVVSFVGMVVAAKSSDNKQKDESLM